MHMCRVDGGNAHCDCRPGYLLAEDSKTCQGKFTSNPNNDIIMIINVAQS